MASIPNILPALTGALQGFSSARGLDLARKLREQAALDELDVANFRQKEGIRAQGRAEDFAREEQAAAEERRRTGVDALLQTLSNASGLGVSGGLGVGDITDNLGAFSDDDIRGLTAGLGSAVTAETARRGDIATREESVLSGRKEERKERLDESLIAQRQSSTDKPFAQLQKDDAGNLVSVLTFPDGQQKVNVVSREKGPEKSTDGLRDKDRVREINRTYTDLYEAEIEILNARFGFDPIPDEEFNKAAARAWEKTKERMKDLGISVSGGADQGDILTPSPGGETAIDLDAIAARIQEGG